MQEKNYIGDVVDSDLKKLVGKESSGRPATFSFIGDVDFIAICVPTPLDAHQQPDIRYVRDSAEAISKHLKKDTMVVLESTTYPGTTEELIRPILEKARPHLRGGFLSRVLARAGGPGQPHL